MTDAYCVHMSRSGAAAIRWHQAELVIRPADLPHGIVLAQRRPGPQGQPRWGAYDRGGIQYRVHLMDAEGCPYGDGPPCCTVTFSRWATR
jgi:hypothetical protein